FGGSTFYGIGAPEGRPGWPVLLRSADPQRPLGLVWLRDLALSTSMSLPEPDPTKSVARGHIVDPRSGKLVLEARFAAGVAPSATDTEIVTKPLIVDPALQPAVRQEFPQVRTIVHVAGREPAIDERLRPLLTAP